jgi:signal peptidase I
MTPREREPLLGLLLSMVLPGLGLVYAGKLLRGLCALLIVVLPSAGLVWYYLQPNVIIGRLWFVPFLVPAVLEALVLVDSYRQVVKYNTVHKLNRVISPGIFTLLVCGMASAAFAVNFAYVGLFLTQKTFVMSYIVPPDSMAPSIYKGERVLVDISAFKKTGLKRGSVIIYRSPKNTDKVYMHRIIGLPGESVLLKDQRVVINGAVVKEPWCERIRYYNRGDFGKPKKPVIVPSDSYYVLGDASANSNDSRFFGFVPKSNLIGHVYKIYYPFNRSQPL